MKGDWFAWLEDAATARQRDGVQRTLRARAPDDDVLDLASNDYLGLARDPRVIDAAVAATRTWGAGATGSRLVTGTTTLHRELEDELAAFCGAPRALVCSSGYTANLAAVAGLAGAGDVIVSDAANHASLIDACRVSRARVIVTPHRDVNSVRTALRNRTEPRALVVTDATFSTDGALAPVAQLHAVCREEGALLLIDEAHSLGVRGEAGQGAVHEAGLPAEPDIVRTLTLSKSLGSQGGAVIATAAVIDHLINVARAFIFDTGLAPAAAAAALGAVRILGAEPDLPARALDRAGRLASLVGAPLPSSAVVPVMIGDAAAALAAAEACRREGVHVGCFRPPSVPDGTSRLRLTARATLTTEELDRGARVVLDAVRASSEDVAAVVQQ